LLGVTSLRDLVLDAAQEGSAGRAVQAWLSRAQQPFPEQTAGTSNLV